MVLDSYIEGVIYQPKLPGWTQTRLNFTQVALSKNSTKRFYCSTFDIQHQKQLNSTSLSKYIWELKDQGINYVLEWFIISRGVGSTPPTGLDQFS